MEAIVYLLLVLLGAVAFYAHTHLLAAQTQWREAVERERDAYRLALMTIKQVQFTVEKPVTAPASSVSVPADLLSPRVPKTQEQQFVEFQQGWTQTDFAAFETWADYYYQGHRPADEQIIADYVEQYGMESTPLVALR